MPYKSHHSEERGIIALLIVIVVMSIAATLALSVVFVFLNQIKATRNIGYSYESMYAAEAGAEDALLRLVKDKDWSNLLITDTGNASASTTISDIIGGARAISAKGNASDRIRKISIAYQVSTHEAEFYYGAQVGDGGVEMRPGSTVNGNVFSNGSVMRVGGGGGDATVRDTVIVANNGNRIDGIIVGRDARVHTCADSTITGTLTYITGGSSGDCTAGSMVESPDEIQPRDFAITRAMIDDWKDDAEAGGIISGDLTIEDDASLGPVKIDGNFEVKGATLTITGTIWATGTFDTGNNVEVRLDEVGYGDLSGVLMADDIVKIRNNAVMEGTSSPSSYLMVISNSSSTDEAFPALNARNNVVGAILFAPNGLMKIDNNVGLVEATAYKLLLENNAEINYEVGLENLEFTSGPSGSWEVTSWGEE